MVTASIGIARQKPDRSRSILAQRRPGALSGKVRRPRHLALVRDEDGNQRPGTPEAGIRFAQSARERSVRALLPAALQSEKQADRGLRGAVAMAASRARNGVSGGIHSGRRGNGTHRRDRQSGACTRLASNAGDGRTKSRSRSICRRSSSTVPTCPRWFVKRSPRQISGPPSRDRDNRIDPAPEHQAHPRRPEAARRTRA